MGLGFIIEKEAFFKCCSVAFPELIEKMGTDFLDALDMMAQKFFISLNIDNVSLDVNLMILDCFFTNGGDKGMFPILMAIIAASKTNILAGENTFLSISNTCKNIT